MREPISFVGRGCCYCVVRCRFELWCCVACLSSSWSWVWVDGVGCGLRAEYLDTKGGAWSGRGRSWSTNGQRGSAHADKMPIHNPRTSHHRRREHFFSLQPWLIPMYLFPERPFP